MYNNFSQFPTFNGYSSYDRIAQSQPMPYANMYGQHQSPNSQTYQQNTNITFVNGIEGAKAYQLSPNSSVVLMDSENSKFYVKSTDSLGVPKLTSYKFVEDNLSENKSQEDQIPVNSTVISNEDLNNILAKIGELEEFRNSIESKLAELL